jgi:hypothetical protein
MLAFAHIRIGGIQDVLLKRVVRVSIDGLGAHAQEIEQRVVDSTQRVVIVDAPARHLATQSRRCETSNAHIEVLAAGLYPGAHGPGVLLAHPFVTTAENHFVVVARLTGLIQRRVSKACVLAGACGFSIHKRVINLLRMYYSYVLHLHEGGGSDG